MIRDVAIDVGRGYNGVGAGFDDSRRAHAREACLAKEQAGPDMAELGSGRLTLSSKVERRN